MVRVWFNHWFSTAYRLIELMKQDEREEIYVIGTNKQTDSVIGKVCDEWYWEPLTEGDIYRIAFPFVRNTMWTYLFREEIWLT
ncbi:MAG: hypothetical protein E7294_03955 [Lachnospiraceae bacterium]|nr:hypothetical protein [Lachnospiraceae bacterium]